MSTNGTKLYQIFQDVLRAGDELAALANPLSVKSLIPLPTMPGRVMVAPAIIDQEQLDVWLQASASATEDFSAPLESLRGERTTTAPLHQKYRVRLDLADHGASGEEKLHDFGREAHIASNISLVHRKAVIMVNKCDYMVATLLPLVERLFKHFDKNPASKVEWLVVVPQPQFQLQLAYRKKEAIWHSVMLLTTSDGELFVLDPSGEQFGFPREHRFLPWKTYKELYVVERENWTGEATFTCRTEKLREGIVPRLPEFYEKARGLMENVDEQSLVDNVMGRLRRGENVAG